MSKFATVVTNDPALASFSLTLMASFKPEPGAIVPVAPPEVRKTGPFGVSPTDKWTTAALKGSATQSTFTFINHDKQPAHITKVIPGGDTFTFSLQTVEEGQRYQVVVSSNPSLKPGKYTQTARLVTDSKETPEMVLDLEVTVYPLVIAAPSVVNLPRIDLASDLSKVAVPTLYVRKVRDKGLKLLGVSSNLPFLNVEILPQQEGELYALRVSIDKTKIAGPGEFHGSITVKTNDPETPIVDIPINGSFSGVDKTAAKGN